MLRPGQVVILCVVALLGLGVVMVNSAVMAVEPVEVTPFGPLAPDDSEGFWTILRSIILSRWTAYAGLAVVTMVGAAMLPVGRLAQRFAAPRCEGRTASAAPLGWRAAAPARVLAIGAGVLLVILSMTYWPGLGREVNGARRWFFVPVPGVGHVSVQPSEIAKWGLIGLLAWYAASRGAAAMSSLTRGLAPALIAAALVAGVVAKEDLGTGVLVGLVACAVLVAAGARLIHFLMLTPVAVAGFIALVITSPYRVRRLATFLDPYQDPQGDGYHMIQSMAAVAGGEGAGRGLGHGLQKFGYLVEDHTDFLFAVICEELGVAGAAAVVGLYALLIWAGASIVARQTQPVLKLIGLGVLATIGLQAVINLAVVTGLAPTKGIALPLLSAGGTGWILTAASLGLLVAMDREAERAPEVSADDAALAPAAA
ncbi:MAG: FtsW/RodA/SpoVE family cell cycle protein [Phycisphaerales bacterium]